MHFGKCVIYSPSSCSEPVWVSFFCWARMKIFWRMLENKQLQVAIDLQSIFFHIMEVNGYLQLFVFQHSSKYLNLCSTEKKKRIFMFSEIPHEGSRDEISVVSVGWGREPWYLFVSGESERPFTHREDEETRRPQNQVKICQRPHALSCFSVALGVHSDPRNIWPLKCQNKWHLKKLVKA